MLLSIIIVNYNTPDLVHYTISSVIDFTKHTGYEIIVVNNGGEKDRYISESLVVTTYNIKNKGFGNACNAGASYAVGTHLLFLNPDTLVHEGTIDTCCEYLLKHPNIGALGVRTLREDGTFDHGCKRGFPTPLASLFYFCKMDWLFPQSRIIGAYRQTFIREDAISDVDSVSGSFLMMPRGVFKAINGFDEAFFLYGEDLDICYRIKQAGYRVVYYGHAGITHLKGKSGLAVKSPAVVHHFNDAMVIFYNKHLRKRYNFLITALVMGGIRLRRLKR